MKSAAIIGCGRPPQNLAGHKVGWGIALAHADGYRAAFPDITLCAVDVNEQNLRAFAERTGIASDHCFTSTEALYKALTPDAASVCTWPGLHVAQTREAIARGVRAITCEKPLGLDGFEIRQLIDHAAERGAKVAVAHQRRYESPFVEAKRICDSGELGEKLVFEGRVGDDWDMLSWTVHWFDMANFFFGCEPETVLAGIHHQGERRYGHAVERRSVVFAEYPGQRQATFITGPAPAPIFGVSVRGERGMLVVGNELQVWSDTGYRSITPPSARLGPFASLFEDLWRSVEDDSVSRCDLGQTAVATQMAFAAQESARTQKTVSFPLRTWYAPLEVMQHPAQIETRPLRVTLLADAHHQWPVVGMSGRDGLVEALEALGHAVRLVDVAKVEPTDSDLAEADLLVLYHTQQRALSQTRRVVGAWFEARRSVVVSHCGIGAYADWPAFREWIGRYWVWGGEALPPSGHPHVPATLRVDDPRFVVPWVEGWLPTDEVYVNLGEAAATHVLAVAKTESFEVPFAWQTVAHPNVVTWLPGHRADMFALDVVRDGLRAAIELAMKQV